MKEVQGHNQAENENWGGHHKHDGCNTQPQDAHFNFYEIEGRNRRLLDAFLSTEKPKVKKKIKDGESYAQISSPPGTILRLSGAELMLSGISLDGVDIPDLDDISHLYGVVQPDEKNPSIDVLSEKVEYKYREKNRVTEKLILARDELATTTLRGPINTGTTTIHKSLRFPKGNSPIDYFFRIDSVEVMQFGQARKVNEKSRNSGLRPVPFFQTH